MAHEDYLPVPEYREKVTEATIKLGQLAMNLQEQANDLFKLAHTLQVATFNCVKKVERAKKQEPVQEAPLTEEEQVVEAKPEEAPTPPPVPKIERKQRTNVFLSDKEELIAKDMVADGRTDEYIAGVLACSKRTIERIRKGVYRPSRNKRLNGQGQLAV
jgi:hypothetical protein